jgi:hypothetical protein
MTLVPDTGHYRTGKIRSYDQRLACLAPVRFAYYKNST